MKKESKKAETASLARQRAQESLTKNRKDAQFAVCINNEGYKAPLELGKLYRMLSDKDARAHGLVRIVDESGEDYAYSAESLSFDENSSCNRASIVAYPPLVSV